MTGPSRHDFPEGSDPGRRCEHCGISWASYAASLLDGARTIVCVRSRDAEGRDFSLLDAMDGGPPICAYCRVRGGRDLCTVEGCPDRQVVQA